MKDLKNFLKNMPRSPGVYKMLDKKKTVMYVGKAKNLAHRVRSYFQKNYEHSTRTQKLLSQIENIDFIETDTELEALILETNLIKELRPKYNILMKDDKSYVYIKVDLAEDFPRIRVVRERDIQKEKEGTPRARFFGPKLASTKVYDTLRILKKLFPFRHCGLDIKWKGEVAPEDASKKASKEKVGEQKILSPNKNLVEVTNRVIDFPCLDYFIKRCPGPCIGAVSPVEYKKVVQQIVDFLDGKTEDLERSLKAQMMEAASQKLFEKAAKIRDKLFSLQAITERQKVTDISRPDTDAINFIVDMGRAFFNVFMIRGGKLVSQENFVLDAFEVKQEDTLLENSEILESFLTQYYERAAEIPKEILIPTELEEKDVLQSWLAERRGSNVKITNPKKGEKNHLLEFSLKNALSFSKQYRVKWMAEQRGETALARLAQVLGIKTPLKRIEGYDISHLGGNETVGSMVVFEKGLPLSAHYRHFKLRTVQGKPDDYRSMEEVVMRRLKYLAKKQNAREMLIKRPNKKDFEEIQRIVKDNEDELSYDQIDKKDFMIMKKGKTLAAFGRVFLLDPKVPLLMTLWVDPAHRGERIGYRLMDKLIAKSKKKRIYLNCRKEFENYYAEYGFVELRQPPQAMKNRIEEIKKSDAKKKRIIEKIEIVYMAYDTKKAKLDPSFSSKPDLLVIDGGKGQLGTAILALRRLKLEIPVISLAKRLEEIFLPGEKAPLLLQEGDEALKLLQRIRDESHRFAITFQRELHLKALIPNITPPK